MQLQSRSRFCDKPSLHIVAHTVSISVSLSLSLFLPLSHPSLPVPLSLSTSISLDWKIWCLQQIPWPTYFVTAQLHRVNSLLLEFLGRSKFSHI